MFIVVESGDVLGGALQGVRFGVLVPPNVETAEKLWG